jgi:tetratricopeptide (TPR) repeat protein
MFSNNSTLWLKSFCHLLVALTFVLSPLYLAHAAEVPTSDNAAYGSALSNLAAGRTQAAIEGFSTIVGRNPNHQGALLDLALAYCQEALPDKAEILFERMLASPDLPPAIQEIINFYRMGACQAPSPVWRTMLAAGFGRAQNLNQAPQSGLLYLSPLDITLQLAEKSRPQTDNVLITEAVLFRQPDSSGWGGGLFPPGMRGLGPAGRPNHQREALGRGRVLVHQSRQGSIYPCRN